MIFQSNNLCQYLIKNDQLKLVQMCSTVGKTLRSNHTIGQKVHGEKHSSIFTNSVILSIMATEFNNSTVSPSTVHLVMFST